MLVRVNTRNGLMVRTISGVALYRVTRRREIFASIALINFWRGQDLRSLAETYNDEENYRHGELREIGITMCSIPFQEYRLCKYVLETREENFRVERKIRSLCR